MWHLRCWRASTGRSVTCGVLGLSFMCSCVDTRLSKEIRTHRFSRTFLVKRWSLILKSGRTSLMRLRICLEVCWNVTLLHVWPQSAPWTTPSSRRSTQNHSIRLKSCRESRSSALRYSSSSRLYNSWQIPSINRKENPKLSRSILAG